MAYPPRYIHGENYPLREGISQQPISVRISLLPNLRKHKFTTHPYFIQFTHQTTVTKIKDTDQSFPVCRFSPQNYNHLLRLTTDNYYLPDVVGQIRMIQDLKPHNPESTSKLIIGILLNSSTMVKLILWNKQASDCRFLQSKKDQKFQVAIFTSIIPRQSKGKVIYI
ncbi:hypothetical protein HID58_076949 [Brassica napus]|uniref:Replication protein A OB domain-containing protein n=1 Tax=Brassica napus TaxID=3708 RepID=A0ABQ7YNY1_BRANA|nr:hypothetical protein HID58_076949 [Brassica napus]